MLRCVHSMVKCCVFWPANWCFACSLLVENIFFNIFTAYQLLGIHKKTNTTCVKSEKCYEKYHEKKKKKNFVQRFKCAAPKRWSKYTTDQYSLFFNWSINTSLINVGLHQLLRKSNKLNINKLGIICLQNCMLVISNKIGLVFTSLIL